MITKAFIAAAGAGVNIPNCVSFRVQSSAIGSTFRIDGTGAYPIVAGEVYRFPPVIPTAGQVGRRRRWMNFRYPDIFINAGTTVPVEVIAAQYDAQHEGLAEGLGGGTFPAAQEGDVIATGAGVGTASVLGQIGVPVLMRNTVGTPNSLVIPSATVVTGNGNTKVTLANENLSRSVASYDTTTGAGLAQDTGLVSIGSTADGIWIEVVFSAVLTVARTIDILISRPDASQYSIFDPIRDVAPSIGIGARNYFAAFGMFTGAQFYGSATASMNLVVPGILPIGQSAGASSGIRVNLGASGGAETTRIRVLTRAGTIT